MSVLAPPRVYFKGSITWDPIVTNNTPDLWDLTTSKPVLNGGTAADYRQRAVDAILTGGNWNPHGTHRSVFVDTVVNGVDCGDGVTEDDPLVGVPVGLQGMLVDVDPYGSVTSQLFFDEMTWGVDGGDFVRARRHQRLTARHINFARNATYKVIAGVASVIWQTSFPKETLQLDDRGSPAMAAFIEALKDPDVLGLTVRFNTYRTIYYNAVAWGDAQEQALKDAVDGGGFQPNPARSVLVGVLGLWRRGESPSLAADRMLLATGSTVASAFAAVHDDHLVIDLSNSIPETSADLTKTDLGPLFVTAHTDAGVQPLGSIPYSAYDRSSYEATSGLVSLRLDTKAKRKAAKKGALSVSTGAGQIFAEQALNAFIDEPSVYLMEGERRSVTFRLRERGTAPGRRVKVSIAVIGGDPMPPQVVETNKQGVGQVVLHGGTPGEWSAVLVPWQTERAPAIPTALNPDLDSYVSVRVWPDDADIAALPPTWANVYDKVLKDWHALAPCMDNWLRLDDEAQVSAYASIVKRLTSQPQFEAYRYMPVTRDMSPGQRTLLHAWCDKVLGGSTEKSSPRVTSVAAKKGFPKTRRQQEDEG